MSYWRIAAFSIIIMLVGMSAGLCQALPTPEYVGGGFWTTPQSFIIDGDKLYATYRQGLQVIDLAAPAGPKVISRTFLPHYDWERGLAKVDGYLYMVDVEAGLYIIDVSNPADPVVVTTTAEFGGMNTLKFHGTHLYAGAKRIERIDSLGTRIWGGSNIFEVPNPLAPELVYASESDLDEYDVLESDSISYRLSYDGLDVMDCRTTPFPGTATSFPRVPGATVWNGILDRHSDALHVVATDGIGVYDLTDPLRPSGTLWVPIVGYLEHVVILDTLLLGLGPRGFARISLAGAEPVVVDTVPFSINAPFVMYGSRMVMLTDVLTILDPTGAGAPTVESATSMGESARLVTGVGTSVYAVDNSGVKVLDMTNPLDPFVRSRLGLVYGPNDIEFMQNRLIVSQVYDRVSCLETTPAGELREVSSYHWNRADGPKALAMRGQVAWAAGGTGGVVGIDFTNYLRPVLRSVLGYGGDARDIQIQGSYAYVADWQQGLVILDLSDSYYHPPTIVATLAIGRGLKCFVSGKYCYVQVYISPGGREEVAVVDISNPAAASRVGSYATDYEVIQPIALLGNYLYVYSGRSDWYGGTPASRIDVVDISDFVTMRALAGIQVAGGPAGAVAVDRTLYYSDGMSVEVFSGLRCCTGRRGDLNLLPPVDLSDLSMLISYLVGGATPPACTDAANVNATGTVDLSDLSTLIAYLLTGANALGYCPE